VKPIVKKKRRSRIGRLLFLVLLAGCGYRAYRYYRAPGGRQAADHLVTLVAAKVHGPLLGNRAPADEVFVPTTLVRSGSFDVSLVAVGALKAKESKPVTVDTFGTVVWTAEDGVRVKKGDPIVQLQNDMMVRQLQDRDTALGNAKQKLEDT
jgi:multidrug efflux pump subunit AcrA (membrane-fusion protein)